MGEFFDYLDQMPLEEYLQFFLIVWVYIRSGEEI